jgi:hypothetical protein
MKKTKSKTRTTEHQQRAAEILQFIRGAAKKNYRHTEVKSEPTPVTVTEKRTVIKKLKKFLREMHQL